MTDDEKYLAVIDRMIDLEQALRLYANRANWRRMPLDGDTETTVDVWYAPIPPWEPARIALGLPEDDGAA